MGQCSSSPRVGELSKCGLSRFIPACVGNSSILTALPLPGVAVHPRVCGELFHKQKYGSMPAGRFIPACVGNSITTALGTVEVSVHPRVCGELL